MNCVATRQNKQAFMQRPSMQGLSRKEKERRWAQHLVSRRQSRAAARRGFTNNTSLVARQSKTGTIAQVHLSPCAQDYFCALVAPFNFHKVACVPDFHAIPSFKLRVKSRGVFSTGADGNGWCVLSAWCNSNQASAIHFSTSALTATSSILSLGTAGTGSLAQTKIPYANADFFVASPTPGVQARTVAVGLRVRYIGPELARSGQIFGVRHPDNETLIALTYDQIKSFTDGKMYQNDRKWKYVMWRPARPDEYHFTPSDSITEEMTTGYRWELGFTIQGTTDTNGAPGSANFEFETIRYVEYVGNISNVTRSHVDVNGMSHVRNSLPTKSTTAHMHNHVMKAVKSLEDSIGESMPAALAGAGAYKAISSGAAEEAGSGISGLLEGISSYASEALTGVAGYLPTLGETGELLEAAGPLLLL